MRIGMCDSGVGGFTVLDSLQKNISADYVYIADLKNCPFGPKKLSELKEILYVLLEKLYNKNVDLIVIACGTLSSIALSLDLTEYKGIKVINIISAMTETIKNSNVKSSTLIATLSTINQKSFENAIKKENVDVIPIACPDFVEIIESNRLEENVAIKAIKKYLTKDIIAKTNNESLVFGCTHYPILKEYISKVCESENAKTKYIIPGESVLDYIKNNITIVESDKTLNIYTTEYTENLKEFTKNMFGKDIKIDLI